MATPSHPMYNNKRGRKYIFYLGISNLNLLVCQQQSNKCMPRQYLKRSKPGIIVRRKLRLGCIVTCSGEQNAAYYCIFLRLTYIRVFIQEIGRRVLIASGSGADRNGRNYRIGSETITTQTVRAVDSC